jgi:tetratricopeptide (TPR) repeat protein
MGWATSLVLYIAALVFIPPAQAQPPARPGFEELLHQGFQLHQQQRYSEALPLLRRAWQVQPRDYFANLLVGIDLLRTGRGAEAVGFLKTAAKLRPQEEFPPEYLGEAQAGLKNYAEATEAYLRAVKVAPQSSQAAVAMVDYSLARFAQISSQLRSSKQGLAAEYRVEALARPITDVGRRKLLKQSVEIDASDAEAWSELALADLAAGDRPNAESDLQRALQLNSDCLSAWLVQALVAAQGEDWKLAAQRLNAIGGRSRGRLARVLASWPQALQPSDSGAVTGAAAIFLGCIRAGCSSEKLLGQLPPQGFEVKVSATELFKEQRWEQIVASPAPPPGQKQAWFQRGSALAQLDDWERATPALERSLGDIAQDYRALFLLAVCYAKSAGAVAARLQQGGREDAVAHTMRGDVLLRLQANGAGAVTEYQTALRLHPDDPRTLERLAEAQFATGDNEASRGSAHAALKLDSHRSGAQRTLARISMQERDYKTALPLLEALAARDPHDLSVRVDLATACAQTGALQDALQNLTPALKAGYPDEKGSLHYLLGTVLRDLGRMPEAKEAFATARKLSDDYQQNSRGDHNAQP